MRILRNQDGSNAAAQRSCDCFRLAHRTRFTPKVASRLFPWRWILGCSQSFRSRVRNTTALQGARLRSQLDHACCTNFASLTRAHRWQSLAFSLRLSRSCPAHPESAQNHQQESHTFETCSRANSLQGYAFEILQHPWDSIL